MWNKAVPTTSTVLGDALFPNPLNNDIIYGAPGGRQLYVSRTRGDSWIPFGTAVPQVGVSGENIIKSIAVNPRDTLQLVLGVESNNGSPDRVMKTTDAGMTWVQTWSGSFEYFGKPVEFKTVHPDTMYTMGGDTLWRSTDFGSTWDTVRTTSGMFAAWCDAEERADSANVLFLGDFSTGIWKTYDYGKHWKLVYSTSGEIPSIAIDPFNPRHMYASRYAGGGGIIASTNWGETWQPLATPISGGGPGWWITCSQSNPGYVYFGVYSSSPYGGLYVSADSGKNWRNFTAGMVDGDLINYGILALDTLSVIALQYDGIWKLTYPPSIRLISPNGGEVLHGGTPFQISWVDSNLYKVRIDYTTNGGTSWVGIADSVPAPQTSVTWNLPGILSTNCRVRVSDALFTTARDTSNAPFTIYTVPLTLTSPLGGEVWDVNSLHFIEWLSFRVDSVRIDFSMDDGATWNPLAVIEAARSYYRWTVPSLVSSHCRIRVTDISDSTSSDQSPASFTIESMREFRGWITVQDHGLQSDSLAFGTHGGATDGIDSATGEVALPPKPGSGTFDVRWRLPDSTTETKIDIRDTLSSSHTANMYFLEFQPGPGGYPVDFTWSPDSLHDGTILLRDAQTHGQRASADMRLDDHLTVSDSGITALEVVQCRGLKISFGQTDAWSMFSIPVTVGDRRSTSLFPLALTRVFNYQAGYQAFDSVAQGLGYWVRTLPTDIFGCECKQESVHVNKGWNMIGSITSPVAVNAIVQVPDSLISSPLYGYDGGYSIEDSIVPSAGYWVKASNNGTLILSANQPASGKSVLKPVTLGREVHTLTLSDGAGHRQTLYFGHTDSERDDRYFEMPPVLPENDFDARFEGGKIFFEIPQNVKNTQNVRIFLTTSKNKIFFSWDVENEINLSYILLSENQDQVLSEIPLQQRGSWSVTDARQLTFSIAIHHSSTGIQVPHQFSLGNVYPNPFNPTASMRYTVPVSAFVSIRIFSMLGQEVARLVDGHVSPGEYSALWNARNGKGESVSSGIYFVRMTGIPDHAASGFPEFSTVERILYLK